MPEIAIIIIGNACSFCAMIANAISGTRKKHKEILGIQAIGQVFYGLGSFTLGGYSATVQNAVGIVRNLAAMFPRKSRVLDKIIEWTLITLGVVLGVVFNNRGWMGWLPIVANFGYSVAMFSFKGQERRLKIAFIINLAMFAVFDLAIMDYVGTASNIVAMITTAVSLIGEKRAEKKAAAENAEAEEMGEAEAEEKGDAEADNGPEDGAGD